MSEPNNVSMPNRPVSYSKSQRKHAEKLGKSLCTISYTHDTGKRAFTFQGFIDEDKKSEILELVHCLLGNQP